MAQQYLYLFVNTSESTRTYNKTQGLVIRAETLAQAKVLARRFTAFERYVHVYDRDRTMRVKYEWAVTVLGEALPGAFVLGKVRECEDGMDLEEATTAGPCIVLVDKSSS